jgi:Tuberculosis necrotizing toxin
MGIELPPELADVAARAGVAWPEADEEEMARSAKVWRDAADTMTALTSDADNTARAALDAVEGETAAQAQRHWATFVEPDSGHLTSTVRGMTDAADRLARAAEQVGAAKVEIVRNLVTLAQNTDAAHSAAAAGHPTALAGLETAVRGTSANVANIESNLIDAVRPGSGVEMSAVVAPVNASPGVHAPGLVDTVGAVAEPVVGQAQRASDLVGAVPGDGPGAGATELVNSTVDAVREAHGEAGGAVGQVAGAAGGAVADGGGGRDAAGGTVGAVAGGDPGELVGDVAGSVAGGAPGGALDVADASVGGGVGGTVGAGAGGGGGGPVGAVGGLAGDVAGGSREVTGVGTEPVGDLLGGAVEVGDQGVRGHGGGPTTIGDPDITGPVPIGGTGPGFDPGHDAPTPPTGTTVQAGFDAGPGPAAAPVNLPPAGPPLAAPPAGQVGGQVGGGPAFGPGPLGPGPGAGPVAPPVAGSPPPVAGARPGGPPVAGAPVAGPPAPAGGARPAGPVAGPPPAAGARPAGPPVAGAPVAGPPASAGGARPAGPPVAGPPPAGGASPVGPPVAGTPPPVGGARPADRPFPPVAAAPVPGPPVQPAHLQPVHRERDEALALFWVHMFPIGHMPVAADKPGRQVPPPPAELDYAAGLRFEPGDHPRTDLVDSARRRAELRAGTPAVEACEALGRDDLAHLTDGHDPLGGEHERDWDRRYQVRFGSVTAEGIRPEGLEFAWPPGEQYPEGGSAEGEPEVLDEGSELDRFGPPEGRVFAEAGTPFANRSLPPAHLDLGYRRYRVCRPLPVWRAVSAAWFAQPGGGVRYRTTHSAIELVALGYLADITREET